MNDLIMALNDVFATNFVVYTQAHIAHLNVQGRNFYSDHKLLEKVYEFLQSDIDTIGEKIRSVRSFAPDSIANIIGHSSVSDYPVLGSALGFLEQIDDGLENLITDYKRLYESAESADYIDISNFAQDQIGQLARLRWMLEATLNEGTEE